MPSNISGDSVSLGTVSGSWDCSPFPQLLEILALWLLPEELSQLFLEGSSLRQLVDPQYLPLLQESPSLPLLSKADSWLPLLKVQSQHFLSKVEPLSLLPRPPFLLLLEHHLYHLAEVAQTPSVPAEAEFPLWLLVGLQPPLPGAVQGGTEHH